MSRETYNYPPQNEAQGAEKQHTASVIAGAGTKVVEEKSSIAPLPSWSRRGYKVRSKILLSASHEVDVNRVIGRHGRKYETWCPLYRTSSSSPSPLLTGLNSLHSPRST